MNLIDNIIGAISKANSPSTIYFCKYTHSDIEKSEIQNLVNKTRYAELRGEAIRCLAIESTDELVKDIRLVGLVFEGDNCYKTIILETYEDLNIYLNDIFE